MPQPHANGITDKDELFSSYAAKNQVQLAKLLGHKLTPQEDFNREFEVAIICCLGFVSFIGLWIACRAYKFAHFCEN